MSYSVILPAPGSLINAAGVADPNGLPAPGFSGMTPSSNYRVSKNRSRSSRGFPITGGEHFWSFGINYHPMQRDQFEAIESFLFGHNTRLRPFYVILPKYADLSETAPVFNTWLQTNMITASGQHYAGERELYITGSTSFVGQPAPGCFINIDDPDNALHKATYKVARVESNSVNAGNAPAAGTLRLTIFPPLNRDVPNNAVVRFINPTFRVLQTNDIEQTIDRNGLYSFSLQLEELLP